MKNKIALRAYYLWLHSDKTKEPSYYWERAEHGLYPLGQCPHCTSKKH